MDRWPSYIFDDRRNASENQVMSPSRVADVKRLDNATGWWQRGALGALPLSQGLMATDVPVAQQRCTQTCLECLVAGARGCLVSIAGVWGGRTGWALPLDQQGEPQRAHLWRVYLKDMFKCRRNTRRSVT